MPPKLRFSDGEKVLCFHGPLIYEAKLLKSSTTKDKQIKYFIHYAGWNKNWDEWVPESRVLKYNETNVAKQREVLKVHANQTPRAKKAKTRKSELTSTPKESDSRASTPVLEPIKPTKQKQIGTPTSGHDSGSEAPKKKRGKPENPVEPEEQFLRKTEIDIKIPDELKATLIEDWDLVNRQKKLVSLPSKLTIDEILDNYFLYKNNPKINKSSRECVVIEFTNAIKEYFNMMLGTQLLYKFERAQYEEILEQNDKSQMSSIYGGPHLLRLFVNLGTALGYTPLDERGVQFVLSHVNEFFKYFVKHIALLFNVNDYESTSIEYQKKVS